MAFSQCSSSSIAAAPNVTPLIDVLLVLLIIFMVIVPVTPRGMSAAVPQPSSEPNAPESSPVVVEVLPGAGGGVSYRVNGRMSDVGGLLSILKQASARSSRPEIFVAGDGRLEYQPIAETVAAAHVAGFHVVGLMRAPKP